MLPANWRFCPILQYLDFYPHPFELVQCMIRMSVLFWWSKELQCTKVNNQRVFSCFALLTLQFLWENLWIEIKSGRNIFFLLINFNFPWSLNKRAAIFLLFENFFKSSCRIRISTLINFWETCHKYYFLCNTYMITFALLRV